MQKQHLKKLITSGYVALVLASSYVLTEKTVMSKSQYSKPITSDILPNKQDLEKIVLSHSTKNQVVMFGERHKAYIKDNYFVIDLLSKLKKQGFNYLALEFKRNPITEFSKSLTGYALGELTRDEISDSIKNALSFFTPGWLDLVDAARVYNIKIICYDTNNQEYKSWDHREKLAFENLKELIFDKDPDAKIIVYCGSVHINEKPWYHSAMESWEQRRGFGNEEHKIFTSLACYLDKYTKGKTLTVFLDPAGNPPPNCDIVIDLEEEEYKYNN